MDENIWKKIYKYIQKGIKTYMPNTDFTNRVLLYVIYTFLEKKLHVFNNILRSTKARELQNTHLFL